MKRPNIYQFVGQNDVSASQHTVYVSHSFPVKRQKSSDFMAAGMLGLIAMASLIAEHRL